MFPVSTFKQTTDCWYRVWVWVKTRFPTAIKPEYPWPSSRVQTTGGPAAGQDSAKFVSDEELIEAYAALLELFVRDGQSFSRVAFVSMLNNMSGLDALIFRKIYLVSLSSPEPRNQDEGWQDASIAKDSDVLFENQNLAIQGILTSELPVRAFPYDARMNSGERHEGFLSQEILVSLGNLARLNLIEPDRIFDGGLNYKLVYRTPLGAALAEALRVKEES